ncbi:extracellular solute-binding protein [Butyrivibrio sp. JL13D10]|uniref:extracellular solute-binding protein n=1 Tax=Butyrivibrio sp. JL13D10 TaxID=3236815 RepID=UPI0038B4CE5A
MMKKKGIALLLTACMTLSLAACGASAKTETNSDAKDTASASGSTESAEASEESKPITIQFWNGWTGSDGQVLIELVDKFNKENKWGITIEMDSTSDFRDKITPAMAANKVPALILGSCSEKYLYEGEIRNLDNIWSDTGMKEADFMTSYLDSLKTEDGLYGIPFQISNYVVYWNKDLFEKAGLDPEAPPTTYDQWTEYAEKITDADNHIYGSGLSYTNYGAVACLMQMFGGEQITKENDKWTAHFKDNQGYKDFIKWFNYQFDAGYNPVEGDIVSMFIAGQVGMYVDGPWVLADVHKYNMNYGVTTLIETPEGGKQAPANTQCFFVTQDCTDEEALAAERFISWWHYGNGDIDVKDTAVYAWSDRIGYPTYFIPVAECEEYKNNSDMNAITINDPEYCMDSIAPGEFRYWSEILTGPVIDLINNLTFYKDKDSSELLDKCQEAADTIINEKYGYK